MYPITRDICRSKIKLNVTKNGRAGIFFIISYSDSLKIGKFSFKGSQYFNVYIKFEGWNNTLNGNYSTLFRMHEVDMYAKCVEEFSDENYKVYFLRITKQVTDYTGFTLFRYRVGLKQINARFE